jgi:hypothetical protein
VAPERYDALLRGDWRARTSRRLRPFLAGRIWKLLRHGIPRPEDLAAGRRFDPSHYRLMDEIGAALGEQGAPVLVVYLPWRDEILGGGSRYGSPEETAEFARRVGAAFVDGRQAFAGLDRQSVRDCWLRFDGHFSERGMERFGRFVGRQVEALLARSARERTLAGSELDSELDGSLRDGIDLERGGRDADVAVPADRNVDGGPRVRDEAGRGMQGAS